MASSIPKHLTGVLLCAVPFSITLSMGLALFRPATEKARFEKRTRGRVT